MKKVFEFIYKLICIFLYIYVVIGILINELVSYKVLFNDVRYIVLLQCNVIEYWKIKVNVFLF